MALQKFAVYAPDTEPGSPKRLDVRPKHLEGARSLIDSGTLKFGGALLTEGSSVADETKSFFGSFMVFQAESIAAVRKIIESDPYYINDVWDRTKIVILPWLQAIPKE